MHSNLLATRRFAPLFWCQFFSAFNDNFLKQALVFLILFKWADPNADTLIALAPAILIFPYFILSAIGGELADRYDKSVVARRLKLAEIAVSVIAVAGFWLDSAVLLFLALFLVGVIAALFGPIKYGILPDHLAEAELPAGNALVEGATFIAILTGTIAAGFASKHGGPASFGGLLLAFALACWISALLIPRTGEAAPHLKVDFNIARSTFILLRDLYRDSRLWWGGIVVSWFWLVGAAVTTLLGPLVKHALGGDQEVINVYLGVFSVAVAAGSGLAAWLSSGRIVLMPTVLGAVLLALFAIDLGWLTFGMTAAAEDRGIWDIFTSSPGIRVAIDLAGLSIGGGLFIVPTFAAVQAWAGADRRARVVAAVNVLNALFIVAGQLAIAALQKTAGVTASTILIGLGVLNLAVAVAIVRTMPVNPVRDLLTVLFRTLFRLEVTGLDNLAKAGPNPIIAVNHVSFLDAATALSLCEREPVFAIDSGIAQRWWVKPFLKLTRAMPLDPTRPLATRALINAVKSGDPLIIFPEGRLTVTGGLMKVYDGAAMIADKSEAMLVPVRIKGLEKTYFTYLDQGQVRRRLLPKVTVTILEPVRLTVDPALRGKKRRMAAGGLLYTVMSDLIYRTTPTDLTIVEAVIGAAAENGRNRVAVEDPLTGSLTYRRLLTGAAVLGRKLMKLGETGDAIGVMLPNTNGAAVTVLAAMSAGRVPAMINFTSGLMNIRSGCRAADIRHILTSRAFVEKAHLEKIVDGLAPDVGVVFLEDVRRDITLGDKVRGLFAVGRPLVRRAPDDPGAILFTSGSEGVPKGVVLSHRNILANAAQAQARIDFGRTDKVLNVLPMFHSFGLTVGFVLPLVSGVRVFLYPTPLHYRIIPEMVYGNNATIMFGTDTFLAGYARGAHAYDFRSLRYLLAGAEPVKEATRRVYMEKFGVRILEGYGITETAPVAAVNTPMFNKFGTVGRLLPGMEARLEPVPGVTEGGRLFLHGPNVMLGYLRAENPGVLEPPPGGWHDTGDIVTIDADGFVTIRGRAKRFAKVGGEMISLAAVEALAADLWPDAISAAATVPDARKGERLVLVTTRPEARRADLQAFARARGASEMMVPADIMILDKLPLLGSGKVDNIALTNLVRERARLEGVVA
jgi:acyl-[acyl-carrier-protein]-phospholipid O-acyltransferase / long-chain-fatty-acid--[acyl-carrier-protein] ligase